MSFPHAAKNQQQPIHREGDCGITIFCPKPSTAFSFVSLLLFSVVLSVNNIRLALEVSKQKSNFVAAKLDGFAVPTGQKITGSKENVVKLNPAIIEMEPSGLPRRTEKEIGESNSNTSHTEPSSLPGKLDLSTMKEKNDESLSDISSKEALDNVSTVKSSQSENRAKRNGDVSSKNISLAEGHSSTQAMNSNPLERKADVSSANQSVTLDSTSVKINANISKAIPTEVSGSVQTDLAEAVRIPLSSAEFHMNATRNAAAHTISDVLVRDETNSTAIDLVVTRVETTHSNATAIPQNDVSNDAISPEVLSLLSVLPDENNTMITLVSMGELVNTFLVEKCIRSIRRRGMFSGIILVFTDDAGYKHYERTVLPWDHRTKIIVGREEDMRPRNTHDGKPLVFAQETMIFKRFKTHHSKYIRDNPDFANSTRYVLYIDTDNLIGNPLDDFFRVYHNNRLSGYKQALAQHLGWRRNDTMSQTENTNDKVHHDGFGFISMFQDTHLRSAFHSGIIMYDLEFETQCVNGWRQEMDSFYEKSDQKMLLRVLENYDRYQCKVFQLDRHYMAFASKRLFIDGMEAQLGIRKKRKPPNLFTFMHVTKYRVNRIKNATLHDEFSKYVLKLKGNETLSSDIMWEDTIPYAARFIG